MTIEKRGNKWRIRAMRDGKTYSITIDHKPGKKEAEELLYERMSATTPVNDNRDTFEISANKYIMIRSNVVSPSTIRGYRTIIKSLSPEFLAYKTAAITQELIQMEINDYSANHSPKSTANLHGFVSAVLSVYNPSLVIRTTLPKKRKYEAVTPSEDDIKSILQRASGTEYEIPLRLGCYGMRRGEICAITAADLTGNMLHITKSKVLNEHNEWIIKDIPKTSDSIRDIYIDDELVELIRKHGEAFTGHPNMLNKRLHDYQAELSLPAFRFHDLRAYYASMAHALGIPDKYIMANGGWSSTRIMDRVYKRAFAEKQAESNQKIAGHLSGKKDAGA